MTSENNITEKGTAAEKICNLKYLSDMTGGKKQVIGEIIEAFLKQIPEEIKSINDAILITDYMTIKSYAHTMRSSASVMGISEITPVLEEIEDLATRLTGIEKINELNVKLNIICNAAIDELQKEKFNYA